MNETQEAGAKQRILGNRSLLTEGRLFAQRLDTRTQPTVALATSKSIKKTSAIPRLQKPELRGGRGGRSERRSFAHLQKQLSNCSIRLSRFLKSRSEKEEMKYANAGCGVFSDSRSGGFHCCTNPLGLHFLAPKKGKIYF